MNIEKKLALWRRHGLLDEAAADRIAAFERGAHRPILLYALGGLGALTIGIGVVSIVASNWYGISRTTKLELDLSVGAVLAVALFASAAKREQWLTDALAGIYYLYVLASLALVGQLYQLGSPHWQGLLTWSAATAPFMLLVRGPLLGAAWLAGLVVTHAFGLTALFGWLDDVWRGGATLDLVVTLSFASVLAYVVVARSAWFVRERPLVSATWTRFAWTGIVIGCLALCGAFYADSDGEGPLLAVPACAAMAVAMHRRLPMLYADVAPRARTGMSALLAVAVFLLAAMALPRVALPAIGALLQVGVLSIAAWTVLALGSIRTFNLLTGLITLRVLAIYFEVFGSMLDTGLGMISGGILTLLLAWLWKRKSPELAARLGADPHVP